MAARVPPEAKLKRDLEPHDMILYAKDSESAALILTSASRRGVALLHIDHGPIDCLIDHVRTSGRQPHIILIEIDGRPDTILKDLERLAEVLGDQCLVYCFGRLNDINFYHALRDMGVADYVLIPLRDDVLDSIFLPQTADKKTTSSIVVGFYGLAGGTGTSTLALNFGNAISTLSRHKIALIDIADQSRSPHLPWRGNDKAISPDESSMQILTSEYSANSIPIAPYLSYLHMDDERDSLVTFDNCIAIVMQLIDAARSQNTHIVLDLGQYAAADLAPVITQCDHLIFVGEPDFKCLSRASDIAILFKAQFPHLNLSLILNKTKMQGRIEFTKDEFHSACDLPIHIAYKNDAGIYSAALAKGAPLLPRRLLVDHAIFEDLARTCGFIADPPSLQIRSIRSIWSQLIRRLNGGA